MHRHKEPSRVLYYPLVWLQMIGIYWTKRVLCYYYVVLIGREGGGTAVEALKLLQSSIHAFQISGTLKLGFLPSNLVNIPPKKWCMILHPKWLYMPFHPPWTHWDSILVERDLLNATIWALSKEKCRLQWENQQQKRTDGRHQSYWPKVARVCVWLALGSFSASMMQKLGLLLRQNTI